jgi:hypothetical protein
MTMANETTIAALSKSFLKHLSADAGPVQRREMRIAFYAGATAVFELLTHHVSDLNQDEACAAMNSLYNELLQYTAELEHFSQQTGAQKH